MLDRERVFCEALDAECRRLGVSSRALAAEAGISESTLGRYRTGLRTPGEKTIDALASALAALSGGAEASDEVAAHLRAPLERRRQDDVALCRRMDALMAEAGLTSSDLARVARVDPSYISRIRSGVRVPADPEALAASCASLAARRLAGADEHELLAKLLGGHL